MQKLLQRIKWQYFIVSILPIFLFLACDFKKAAIGYEDKIIIVADSAEYYELEPSLLTVFGKTIHTPRPENMFELQRIPYEQLDMYRNYKNIVIVAPINSKSQAAQYLRTILDPAVIKLINKDSVALINKHDLWAYNQLFMIITAPDMKKLSRNILRENNNIVYAFQKKSNERMFAGLYNEKYEKKDIEAKFLKNYNWMIYVQADFLLSKEAPADNFVWLRRSPNSDRETWLFVHWIENASPNYLAKDSITAIRNRMTKKYYVTNDNSTYVEMVDTFKTTREVDFKGAGRYALLTQGVWRMTDHSMGGPFINYTFFDEKTNRIYMLDGSIFAPRHFKKKLIQQADVILQSFLMEYEVKPEKKEELLDLLEE